MKEDKNYKTYLYISSTKLIFKVKNIIDKKDYYNKQIFISDFSNNNKLRDLDNFLEDNIEKIEKKTKNFVKNIILLINNEEFFSVNFSTKKKKYEDMISQNSINRTSKDAQILVRESYQDKAIIHMLIKNYFANNKVYSYLPQKKDSDYFSLEFVFIFLSEQYVNDLKKIFTKYHIKIEKIVSVKYIENFFYRKDENIFDLAQKIIDGYNSNEVILIPKVNKNKGFFEKFFNLFS